MRTTQEITPLLATHPGEILKDELEALACSQLDFAKRIGLKRSQLNEIIKGKRPVNADLAILLEKATGIDANYWLEAQKNFDLDSARIAQRNQERLEALDTWEMIKPQIPVKFLKKEKHLTGDPVLDIPIVKNIYGIINLEQLPQINTQPTYARFRKSEKLKTDAINIIGWSRLVHYKAKNVFVKPFKHQNKQALIDELKQILSSNTNTLISVQEVLANYGIKLIYQAKGEKTPVDGIAFWSENNPAIGMTLRHKRLDNFAFTLFHELGHVFEHLVNQQWAEYVDLTKDDKNYKLLPEEIEADAFASNHLINIEKWELFYKKASKFTDAEIIQFAKEENIHPCIIRGRVSFITKSYGGKTRIKYAIC